MIYKMVFLLITGKYHFFSVLSASFTNIYLIYVLIQVKIISITT